MAPNLAPSVHQSSLAVTFACCYLPDATGFVSAYSDGQLAPGHSSHSERVTIDMVLRFPRPPDIRPTRDQSKFMSGNPLCETQMRMETSW